MRHSEAVSLIKHGITGKGPQYWADLGCGSGTFTLALRSLLPIGSRLTAVDKDSQNLPVNFIKADFEKEVLPLSGLDGILMANSLHFVRDKETLFTKLESHFSSNQKFLIVEYDTARANRWVPYPIPFDELGLLFTKLGYSSVTKLAEHPSRFGGSLYGALIMR
ncbi:class I SAM-dependent methyltransferase [Mucilaginibacter sp.]|uniref:class I SAM-dependent methyltransferase n=1 Tax=Mucilaginibacter sp. TaxID=1882438 RepID=UPI003D137EF0